MFSIPGFDEDRHGEADAARPEMTKSEQLAAAGFDEWCATLASLQAPLDGCEDEVLDWHDVSAPVDAGEVAALLEDAPMVTTAVW